MKFRYKLSNPFFVSVIAVLVFYVLLKFVIQPPLPSSIIGMYMVTIIVAVILYVSSSEKTFQEFLSPINYYGRMFLTQESFRTPRLVVGILLPLLIGWISYNKVLPKYEPPAEGRNIHPAPPSQIKIEGEKFVLAEVENPFWEPDKFEAAKEEGWEIYFAKCMPCHGGNLEGKGHWADKMNPIPINFRDPGTIAMMSESFIFWRIAKGGKGLPGEGAPWNSAMPVWEHDLSKDEIWKVSLYIYDESGFEPRKWE